MKIQISFKYKDKNYQYEIDDRKIDMNHYDKLWDWWETESTSQIANNPKYSERDIIFEFTGNKKLVTRMGGEEYEIISGEGLYINVYESLDADDFCDQILAKDIEILYM